jgi:alkaline phosphatase D
MRYLVIALALFLNFHTCVTTPATPDPTGNFSTLASLSLPLTKEQMIAPPEAFPYGVASGDPLTDRVILWSMLKPELAADSSSVRGSWEIATDPEMQHRVNGGRFVARADRHFRIKIDAAGLTPDTYYYYRFRWRNYVSPVGRTKTAPPTDGTDTIRLAIVSCNAYEWGYFNAFASLARREQLDAVVHLGDYIYEYATGEYGDTTLGRRHDPPREAVSEADYHRRYAQYRSDPDLQQLHRLHPFISIWDDHEVANNNYTGGAENHQASTEGNYLLRMTAARQLYYDWMPIRETPDGRLYRRFRFGRTADLILLDERLAGRTAPAQSFDPADLQDSSRTMLGARQFAWLQDELSRSTTAWRLIGNQVLFADLDLSRILPEYAVNLDAWDGYRAEKNRLIQFVRKHHIENLIFLTGDTHCSWFFEVPGSLTEYRQNPSAAVFAYELGTPSISSANYDELIGGWDTLLVARQLLYRHNPHLQYVNLKEHGYLLLEVDTNEARADFYFERDIRQPGPAEYRAKSFHLPHSTTKHNEHTQAATDVLRHSSVPGLALQPSPR